MWHIIVNDHFWNAHHILPEDCVLGLPAHTTQVRHRLVIIYSTSSSPWALSRCSDEELSVLFSCSMDLQKCLQQDDAAQPSVASQFWDIWGSLQWQGSDWPEEDCPVGVGSDGTLRWSEVCQPFQMDFHVLPTVEDHSTDTNSCLTWFDP